MIGPCAGSRVRSGRRFLLGNGGVLIRGAKTGAVYDSGTAHRTWFELSVTTQTSPGLGALRPAPAGLPDPNIPPTTLAETGDPSAAVRILELVARIPRGQPIRLDDLVDRLNATYLDWLFPRSVVVDVLVALQANWMTDYRNSSGIVLEDGPYGATVQLEDSTRVDPWIVRQVQREATAAQERLAAFARRDRLGDQL